MRIRINEPSLADELLAALSEHHDCVAERVEADEIEVSLLGSYAEDAQRTELALRVQAWAAVHEDAAVELV